MSSVGKVGALTAAAFAGAGLFFVGCKDDKNNPSPSPGPPGPPGPPEKFVCTMNSDCNSRFGYGFGCVGKPGMCVFNQCDAARGDTKCREVSSDDGSYTMADGGGDACCPSNYKCSYEEDSRGKCVMKAEPTTLCDENSDTWCPINMLGGPPEPNCCAPGTQCQNDGSGQCFR